MPARHALGARATERARAAEEVFGAVSDHPWASARRAHAPIGSPLDGWRKLGIDCTYRLCPGRRGALLG